jgi:hypothetical protein
MTTKPSRRDLSTGNSAKFIYSLDFLVSKKLGS